MSGLDWMFWEEILGYLFLAMLFYVLVLLHK